MKKVLVITYYWPPSGGSGVQRWLKFVKYLPEFGWQPIVFAPENADYPVTDDSLLHEVPKGLKVIKHKIWEPYLLYRKLTGNKQKVNNPSFLREHSSKDSIKEKIAVWIRGNLFIPDARCFWVDPSVHFLEQFLKREKVDAIVTTAPPHSVHLIGLGLSKKLNIPWIADFRDPWTNIDFVEDLQLTKWARKKHSRLERKVLEKANTIISVGYTLSDELRSLGARNVETITNGFDEADFEQRFHETDEYFSITHMGSLTANRNCPAFWRALSELCIDNKDFAKSLRIRLVGKIDNRILQNIEHSGLLPYLENVDYIEHQHVPDYLTRSQLLFLPINKGPNSKGILTGKLFEYLASGRPILAIGPTDGDVSVVLKECMGGTIIDFDDVEGMKRELSRYFNLFEKKRLESNQNSNIRKFSRRCLTERLAEVLNRTQE